MSATASRIAQPDMTAFDATVDSTLGNGIKVWPPMAMRSSSVDLRPRPVAHAARGLLLFAERLAEAVMITAAGLAVPYVMGTGLPEGIAFAVQVMAVALLVSHLLGALGLYDTDSSLKGGKLVLAATVVVGLAVPVTAFFVGLLAGKSLGDVWMWGGVAAVGVLLLRLVFGAILDLLSRWNTTSRRVLLVGERSRCMEALSLMAGGERAWAMPVGVCIDDHFGAPTMGGFISSMDRVEELVHSQRVDDVIVALPWNQPDRMSRCLNQLKPLTANIHLLPETQTYQGARGMSLLAGVPLATMGVRPLEGWRRFLKEAEDRILGSLLLVAISPLMAVIALAIKLDSPGPVFFRQSRYGYDNKEFMVWKFRSMYVRPVEEAEVKQATKDDPRVTRVGKFIRRTSLDELPQLINVVMGSMSLVGPRPHAVSHHHYYTKMVDDYRCRHRMKPGITGWAAVNGYRGETISVELMQQRVIYDLWYIDNWSLWLDLVTLAKTPASCLTTKNAY